MVATSRTDQILAELTAEIEAQRPVLDAGGPLSSVSVIAYFTAGGKVRQVHFRADRKRDIDQRDGDRRLLANPPRKDY